VRLTALSIGLGLVLWELVAILTGGSRALVPDLGQIARAFASVFTVGYPEGTLFYTHLAVSLGRILTGVLTGAVAAVVLGFVIGWFPAVYALCHLVITVARGIPAVALIPLAIVWLGIDEASKVALIFYASFWIMLTHVVDAVRRVSPDLVRAGQVFGLTQRQLFAWVVLPATLPRVLTGLRIGLGMGFVVVITAEMVGTVRGMGAMIMDARRFFRPDIVIVGMILVGLVGGLLSTGLGRLERRLTRWAEPEAAR
jgi:ABC-type nitrate/sulfonate/bicarbonate transport system permease component